MYFAKVESMLVGLNIQKVYFYYSLSLYLLFNKHLII